MRRHFTFEARLELVAGHVQHVLGALGAQFAHSLVEAAVHEALTNAIVYGALGVSTPGCHRDLEQFFANVEHAQQHGETRVVEVWVEAAGDGTPDVLVRVRDPGRGFDWRLWLGALRAVAPPSTSWSNVPLAGRGLVIMSCVSKSLQWNEAGNEVVMRFAPIEPRPRLRDTARVTRAAADRLQGSRSRVLLVDADARSRLDLSRVVQSIGFDVRECLDSSAALQHVHDWGPNVVLVNASLPDSSGLALCGRIAGSRGRRRAVPVAFVTTHDVRLVSKAMDSGAFDCLQLPMWTHELSDRLRRALCAPDG